MNKHYKLTDKTKMLIDGTVLHRIQAIDTWTVNGHTVTVGDLGGWVESIKNIEGDAQVYGDAKVYCNALVCGDAQVYGDAKVYCDALVYGDAQVCGNALVYGDAQVCGDALVCGNARVCGDAQVYGDALVCGNARVCGDAWVCGDARVCGDAWVSKSSDYMTIGPIGSRNDTTTFFKNACNGITVSCGRFLGTIEDFSKKVLDRHGDSKYAQVYLGAARLAEMQIGGCETGDVRMERSENDETD